ncbi:hypothetical protein, partial [Microvirga puerhi]
AVVLTKSIEQSMSASSGCPSQTTRKDTAVHASLSHLHLSKSKGITPDAKTSKDPAVPKLAAPSVPEPRRR